MSVIGEYTVREAAAAGHREIVVGPGDVVTPQARDVIAQFGLRVVAGPVTVSPPVIDEATAAKRVLLRRSPKWMARKPTPRKAAPFDKIAMVGSGAVGATTAHLLAMGHGAQELVLIDLVPGLAESTALDINHASGITRSPTTASGGQSSALVAGADVVVVTAGRPRSPGMSRADLSDVNGRVIRSVAEAVGEYAPDAVMIIVTNPLDEMTYEAYKAAGFPRERVLGMAGTLDSSRFRWALADAAGVDPGDVFAFTLGSHGDEMVPVVSAATIRGRPAVEVLGSDVVARCVRDTVGAGGQIVALRKSGSASIAPAHAIAELVDAMRLDHREPVPVSVVLDGEYGIFDAVVGVPALLNRGGLERVVELELTATEFTALQEAAAVVKERLTG